MTGSARVTADWNSNVSALLVIGSTLCFAPGSSVLRSTRDPGDNPAQPGLPPPPFPFCSRSPMETWMRASNETQTVADECRHKEPESRCPQTANSENTLPSGLKRSPLFKYASSPGTYHCPGDLRTRQRRPGQGWAYDSYSKADGMHGLNRGQYRDYTKEAQITAPSMSVVFVEETDPRSYNRGTWFLNFNPPGWVDPFAIFHGNWSTFSFADGHSEGHKWVDPGTIKAATDSAKGIESYYWQGGNARNPDFRWMYERYRHQDWKPLP